MTENERLLSLVTDKIRKTENAYMLTHTNFLSLSERSLATSCCKETARNSHFGADIPKRNAPSFFFCPIIWKQTKIFRHRKTIRSAFCIAVSLRKRKN